MTEVKNKGQKSKRKILPINHLHVHSTFSFLDGYGNAEQYIERLNKTNQQAMALTDHGGTWGHVPFYMQFKKAGKKLLLGIEAYYIPNHLDRDDELFKDFMRKRYHISLVAKNQKGLENLYKLVTWSNLYGFYYKPMISNEMLFKYQEGIVVMSGCMGSGFPIKHYEDHDRTDEWIQELNSNVDDFYFEISPLPKVGKQVLLDLVKIGERNDIPIAMTSDVHFPSKEDYVAEDIMLAVGMRKQYDDPDRMRLWDDLYLWDTEETNALVYDLFGEKGQQYIEASNKIVDTCNVEIPTATPLRYYKGKDFKKKALDEFKRLIDLGIESRGMPDTKEYKERLLREADLIIEKDYVDYFLIISDLVRWAKKTMLVGPARGSAAGSLVAYLLYITEVDPIPHKLIFERFIDVTREDLPDVDIDFPHIRRHEILEYLVQKYGEDHVSLLGTLGFFKSKNSIWDVGRIYDLPRKETQDLANTIIERSSGDARASFCIEDSINEFEHARKIVDRYPKFLMASKIEGQVRQSGVHAAAVVIANEPLQRFGSFAKYKEDRVLCMDKKSAEKLNLLKIDVLGLKQLTVIEEILRRIGKDSEWLYALPLEDECSYGILKNRLFQGIFQFEGNSLKKISMQSEPDTFHSMQEISALARPGALHCGGTAEYLDRRAYERGQDRSTAKPTEYVHPLVEKVSKDTYGVIIYQEQVMRIMREVGNMSWEDTALIRRLISKSMGVEYFNTFYEKFKIGAKDNGLTEDETNEIWRQVETMGSWAFNLSHSVSYGYMSYWTLYLKAHYPAEFYIATLQYADTEDKIKYLLREWVQHFGGKYQVIHPDKSKMSFELIDGVICGGYTNLKGIGLKTAEKIMRIRDDETIDTFAKYEKAMGKKAFEILTAVGGIPRRFNMEEDTTNLDYSDWADLYPIGEEYAKYYDEYNFTKISDITEKTGWVRVVGKIVSFNLRSMEEYTRTKKGMNKNYKDQHLDKFYNLTLEDDTGQVFVGISRYLYEATKAKIQSVKGGGILAVQGRKIPGMLKITVKKPKDVQVLKIKEV